MFWNCENVGGKQHFDFSFQVNRHCEETRNILIQEWVPEAVKLFLLYKDSWTHLVPLRDGDSTVLVSALPAHNINCCFDSKDLMVDCDVTLRSMSPREQCSRKQRKAVSFSSYLCRRWSVMVKIVASEPWGTGFDSRRKHYWYSSGKASSILSATLLQWSLAAEVSDLAADVSCC